MSTLHRREQMPASSTATRRGDTTRVRELLAAPRLSLPRHIFDPAQYGPHLFPGVVADENGEGFFTSDCEYGCGAWMGSSRSGGPDNGDRQDGAHGPCPNNPRVPRIHPETGQPTGGSYLPDGEKPEPLPTAAAICGNAPADACAILQPIPDVTQALLSRLIFNYSQHIADEEMRRRELLRIFTLAGIPESAGMLEMGDYPRGLWNAPLPEWLVSALWQRCPRVAGPGNLNARWRLTDILYGGEAERLEGGVVCSVCQGMWGSFESSETAVLGREIVSARPGAPGQRTRRFSRCQACDKGWVYPDDRGIPSPRGLLRLAPLPAAPVMLLLLHVMCPFCLNRRPHGSRVSWVSVDCEMCAGTNRVPLVVPEA